jgi:hypothetical protein
MPSHFYFDAQSVPQGLSDVIASAATDEDAPPEPAKAYFAGFTARLKPRPFKTKFKNTVFPRPAGLPGLLAAAY